MLDNVFIDIVVYNKRIRRFDVWFHAARATGKDGRYNYFSEEKAFFINSLNLTAYQKQTRNVIKIFRHNC